MKRRALVAGLVLLGASGCVTVTGPKAIRPGPAGIALGFEQVDTLSPLLEWEPSSEADAPAPAKPVSAASATAAPASTEAAPARAGEEPVCYDVAVHEVARNAQQSRPGARVYSREGIAGTSHRIEAPLDPGRDYYWFVRTRRGDRVGPWSRYGYFLFLGFAWMSASNQPYRFRTPGAAPAAESAQEGAAGGTGTGAPGGAGSGPPFFYQ